MTEAGTFAELVQARARATPERVAYTFRVDDATRCETMTYAQAHRAAVAIAAWFAARDAAGQRALILCRPGLDYIAALYGCFYAGVIAVPAYPPHPRREPHRLNAIVADCAPRYALTDAWNFERLQPLIEATPALRELDWHVVDAAGGAPGDGAHAEPRCQGAEAIAFLQYTSGSTGTPKGVRVTHGNLLHNARVIYDAFGHSPESHGLIWLPPYHDMGLIGGILQPLYGGFPVTLMSPFSFLQRPLRWLRAVSDTRATTSGGPCFAYELCLQQITPEQRDTLDLSRWDLAFCGAEPIRADVFARFAEYFAPCGFRREAFYACYGMAEATLMISGGEKKSPPVVRAFSVAALERHVAEVPESQDDARMLVGCGVARPEMRVVVVDPERGGALPEGRVGEVWIAGPSVSPGYWKMPPEGEYSFQAALPEYPGVRFLRSGDLGFLQKGELFLTGRIKELIIVAGRNHYPHDIERTAARAHPELQPHAVAAFGVEVEGEERVVIGVEVSGDVAKDGDTLVRAIRRLVWEEHDLALHDVCLLPPMRLPRTSSGKTQRFTCREAWRAGGWGVRGERFGSVPTAE